MAFPSNVGSSPLSLAKALDRVMEFAGQIKTQSQTIRSQSAAGPISATAVIQFAGVLASLREQMASTAATPGLASYVQAQFPSLDLTAAYTAMLTQLDATIAWMLSNFPKAGTGELLERKFLSDGRTVSNTFSSAALATFRTQLDLLIAQID